MTDKKTIDNDEKLNLGETSYQYDDVDNDELINNTEYIDYSSDQSDLIKFHPNDEIVDTENYSYEIQEIKTDIDKNKKIEEIFNCSSCNLNFNNLVEHIQNYHSDHAVTIDNVYENSEILINNNDDDNDDDDNNEKNIRTVDLKEFNIIESEYDSDIQIESEILDSGSQEFENFTDNDNVDEILPDVAFEFSCEQCNLNFNKETHLNKHIETNHVSVSYEEKINDESDMKKLPEQSTTCGICNTVFPTLKSLKLHARMHNPVQLKSFKETLGFEYKKHFKNIQYFNCEICKKKFDCKLKNEHKKFHQNDKKINEFVCSKCNKKFLNQTSFTMHLKIHENQMDKPKKPTKAEAAGITLPYACQYCGREFGRPHEKVKHERIHTGEKPFKCEVCGKCFRVTYSLTLHLRTHTTARPYVCPACNKRFKSYSVYAHHLLTHSENRPYKCPNCPKSFKTSVQLHGHINSHLKPFNCPECNRPFATMYGVKTHMETHKKNNTNMKQCCTICGATYARIFALKDHMREVHECKIIKEIINNDDDDDNEDDLLENNIILMDEKSTGQNDEFVLQNEEITITENINDHYETEEVVTDWFK